MKIGIIVYSQTGNTYSVVIRLKEKLGSSVSIERIEVEGEVKPNNVKLKTIPKVDKYDTIIFAAPVQAFSLCAPMKAYLNQLGSLKGKKVGLIVTEGFPYPWMGGNHAIKQMKNICELKEAKVIGSGIVNWPKNREEKIKSVIDDFSQLLGENK